MKSSDLFILGIVFGGLLVYYLIRLLQSFKLKHRYKKSKKAEAAAQKYLEQQGYSIIAQQKRVPIITKIDSKSFKNHVKADFIVKKDGLKYVVEVKTGKQVEKPTSAGIRRQLLEYYLIYRTNGVLLLDMENKRIHAVEFEIEMPWQIKNIFSHLAALAAGALLGLLLVKGGLIG
ncbi:MAG: hypothetical protein H0Z40_04005 [Desulfotomaculum sp.]|nr:hypothetical protein [Desulfotomaculum sp.]